MIKKFLILTVILIANVTFAKEKISLISDAETENYIKALVTPLVKVAKLNPENITIRIINDPELNAFVTNGTNIFINTGLIIQFADDPNVLYGVLAHELAHIYAGHLTKMRRQYDDMSNFAVGGTILGIASALAGSPSAGSFIGLGSMQMAQSNILQYSRENETEADKLAVDFLYKTHNNGSGLIKFFQYVSQRDRSFKPDPYAITHPLSIERIASIKNSIKEKLGKFGDNITPKMKFELKRIATKLEAFLTKPQSVIKKFKNNTYALSIGYFRSGQLSIADSLLEQVIKNEPNNPYLWELKGQFYFENGKLKESEQYYKKALGYLPQDNIIKLELAAAQLNQGKGPQDSVILNSAIKYLNQIVTKQNDNILAYFMLARAYGTLGENAKAMISLAEYYFYQGEFGKSHVLAAKVINTAPKGSKEYIRAQDIIEFAKTMDLKNN